MSGFLKRVFDRLRLFLSAKRKGAWVELLDLRFRVAPVGVVVKGEVFSNYNVGSVGCFCC